MPNAAIMRVLQYYIGITPVIRLTARSIHNTSVDYLAKEKNEITLGGQFEAFDTLWEFVSYEILDDDELIKLNVVKSATILNE